MKHYDVLVVGRGIAGNTLALTLLEKGLNIHVVDLPQDNSASMRAAGLFNPFTGKNTVKTWLADELFPFLHDFYQRIEQRSGEHFFHPRVAYRPFLSNVDYNDWTGRSSAEQDSSFVNPAPDHTHYRPWINNPMGGIEYRQAGYVDAPLYLAAGQRLLEKNKALLTDFFYHRDVEEKQDGIVWKGNHYRYIVFCEGIRAKENPFFPAIPLVPNKGEILMLHIPDLPLKEIITKGVFLIQKEPGLFQAGSTYRWKFEHEEPEARGSVEIREKLDRWLSIPYTETSLLAGVRPASKDRRPLMGYLNEHPRLLIFNGLGTKGISLAPYWAEQLAQSIIQQKDLPKDVDIRRFYLN